jgi:ribosomal protein S18 acetylase RimI-like enzyme
MTILPVFLHEKSSIAKFLTQDALLHLYELGDLDNFFWPYTTWIADQKDAEIQSIILVYTGGGLPVVLALEEKNKANLRSPLSGVAAQPLLPRRFYLHLSPGLANILAAADYRLQPHGRYLKMALMNPALMADVDTTGVIQLGTDDQVGLKKMYAEAYPGNWFDLRMLETGCFFGICSKDEIVSAAGIHVFSVQYRAAALGNICTHPDYRGKGYGMKVTARLCQHLSAVVDKIGLNVQAENTAALKIYSRLGFEPVAEYEEYMVETV